MGEFTSKYDGKFIDYDGKFGAQCVDLARQYVKEVLGYPQCPPVVGAADLWDSCVSDFYEKVPNTPTGVPQSGDIVIWNRKLGNGYGHVAIFDHGNASAFVSFDQNYPLGTPCHFQKHTYSSVTGWLHPKESMTEALEACMQDRESFWKQRDEALAKLLVKEEECQKLSQELDECKKTYEKQLSDLSTKIEHLEDTNEALRTKNEELQAKIDALHSQNPLDGYSGLELIVEGIKKLVQRKS